MECLSLIGVAVGRETFRADANEIMQTLLAAGITFDDEEDPEVSYMISSWARVCKILGAGRLNYTIASLITWFQSLRPTCRT